MFVPTSQLVTPHGSECTHSLWALQTWTKHTASNATSMTHLAVTPHHCHWEYNHARLLHNPPQSCCSRAIWPIMWKHDVINKNKKYVSVTYCTVIKWELSHGHSYQVQKKSWRLNRWFSRYASWMTDRETDIHTDTLSGVIAIFHTLLGQSKNIKWKYARS